MKLENLFLESLKVYLGTMQLLYNSFYNLRDSSYSLFTSDSVFEDEGAETPPTAAQPAEGDKPESNPNPATEGEEGEQQPTQLHSGTGQNLNVYAIFILVYTLSCLLSLLFCSVSVHLSATLFFFHGHKNVHSGLSSRR